MKKKNGIIAGYGIHFPNREFEDISQPFTLSPLTNQRAELFAIYTALNLLQRQNNYAIEITIYTDSMYAINSITKWIYTWAINSWRTSTGKPVMNQDIIKPIYDILLKFGGNVHFRHVASHTGASDFASIGNARADKLATDGALFFYH